MRKCRPADPDWQAPSVGVRRVRPEEGEGRAMSEVFTHEDVTLLRDLTWWCRKVSGLDQPPSWAKGWIEEADKYEDLANRIEKRVRIIQPQEEAR